MRLCYLLYNGFKNSRTKRENVSLFAISQMALKINERIQHLIIQETITNIQQIDTELPRL